MSRSSSALSPLIFMASTLKAFIVAIDTEHKFMIKDNNTLGAKVRDLPTPFTEKDIHFFLHKLHVDIRTGPCWRPFLLRSLDAFSVWESILFLRLLDKASRHRCVCGSRLDDGR